MPARPLSDETLHLIDAIRTALAHRSDVQERPLFGTHAFFVDGKMCIAVKGEDLLVRLPPERHSAVARDAKHPRAVARRRHAGLLLGRAQRLRHARAVELLGSRRPWTYNPQALASPRKKKATKPPGCGRRKQPASTGTKPKTKAAAKKHSIFEADD